MTDTTPARLRSYSWYAPHQAWCRDRGYPWLRELVERSGTGG
jgi:hypothetical protein